MILCSIKVYFSACLSVEKQLQTRVAQDQQKHSKI